MLCSLLRAFKVFFLGNAYYSSTATVHSDKNLSTVAITYTLQHSTLHIDNSITIINDYQYRHCFPQKHTDRYVYLSYDLHQKLKKIDQIPSFYHLSDSQLYKKQYKRTRINTTTQNRSTYTVPPRPSDKHHYFSTPPSTHSSKPTPTLHSSDKHHSDEHHSDEHHSDEHHSEQHHSDEHHSDTVVHSTPRIAIRPITRHNDVEYKTITQTNNLSESNKQHITEHSTHLDMKLKSFNLTSNQHSNVNVTLHSTIYPTFHLVHNDLKKKEQVNITTDSNFHSGQSSNPSNYSSPLPLQVQHSDKNDTSYTNIIVHNNTNTSSSNVSNKGSNGYTRNTIVVFTPSRRFIQSVHSSSISNTTSISSSSHRILPVKNSTSHKMIPPHPEQEHDHENEQEHDHENEHEHENEYKHHSDTDAESESERDD